MTQGVLSLPAEGQSALLEGVRRFNSFNADNNLYNEHDFGNLKHAGVTYFWKIDYYDQDLQFGSPDAADPNVTKRVMTLMRADEY
ncbi:conserved hypothetical protein [Pseudovibrio sp. JE062]|nr:conserved hypothetical protein [Pseudovibrio sp. JE062]